MLTSKQEWWTDERVEATVTRHYICSHLRPDEAEKLSNRVFATFSDETYIQWIQLTAKRLFLTLVDSNLAGQIFRLIDESYDDEDLPFTEENVQSLRFQQSHGQTVNQLFYRSQFKYLFRVVQDGEHLRYAKPEIIPLQSAHAKLALSTDRSDKVVLPSVHPKSLLRKQIDIEKASSEIDVLSEIAALRPMRHQHIISVFGSYTHGHEVNVLLQPSTRHTLKTFLNDTPKAFEALAKAERRTRLLEWISCLSNAVAWLHHHKIHHGAVRPSRIMIDDNFRPTLGQFENDGVLGTMDAKDDLEAYQYAAPEFWIRESTPHSTIGATASNLTRNVSSRHRVNDGTNSKHANHVASAESSSSGEGSASFYGFVPTSKGKDSRLKLESFVRKQSVADASDRDPDAASSTQYAPMQQSPRLQNQARYFDAVRTRSSDGSEHSSASGRDRSNSLYFIPAETKYTVVQTWKSTAYDLLAADVFALSAVTMDILTVFCGRTTAAFAKHRSTKNRQAGRGGGAADASFHANLPQVASWADLLHKDSEKKIQKNEGYMFRAVGPALQMIVQCFDRDPEKRIKSFPLAKGLQKHLLEFANFEETHCKLNFVEKKPKARKMPSTAPTARVSTPSRRGSRPSEHSTPARSISRDWLEYEPDTSTKSRHPRRTNTAPAAAATSQLSLSDSEDDSILLYDPEARVPSRHLNPAQSITSSPKISSLKSSSGDKDRSQPRPLNDRRQPLLHSYLSSLRHEGYMPESLTTPSATTAQTLSISDGSLYPFPNVPSNKHKPPDRDLPPVPSKSSSGKLSRSSSTSIRQAQAPIQQRHIRPDRAKNSGLTLDKHKPLAVDSAHFEMHPGSRLNIETPPPTEEVDVFAKMEEFGDEEFDLQDLVIYGIKTASIRDGNGREM